MTEAPVRPAGRPRSAEADEAIIDATIALLGEEGFDRVSMEHVAARAGVGKATVYRRWPSKEALVIDAVARRSDPLLVEPTGPVAEQLVALLEAILATSRTGAGRLLPCMIGASISNPALAEHYREQIIGPRRERVAAILRRAAAAGELRADADLDVAIDQVVSPLVYRIVLNGADAVDPAYCRRLVESTLRGLAP